MHWAYRRSLSRGPVFGRLIDELYPSLSSSADFRPRIVIRRNLMHADSFLYISRVAASKNHTFFNHFLCLQLKHYRESLDIFARCPFLMSCSIFGHIWPSGGLMRTIGENIDKTAFTFSACKKKDSIFLKFFFENEFLKDMEIYQKKTNWRVRSTLTYRRTGNTNTRPTGTAY